MSRIYLDHAATTPLRPEAREAMLRGFGRWANPSSPHADGRRARAALEDARERVKAALGWDGELIFTSGASEAAALALERADAGKRLVSAVEHEALLKAAPAGVSLPVRGDGALDLAALRRAIEVAERPLVAVQTINSETGNEQALGAVGAVVHDAGGLVLADCAQSAGKRPLPAGADMAIVSAHKFGGPIGIGALLIRDYAMLRPSGGQERGYRRGTENLPGVLGMAAALEAGGESYMSWSPRDAMERFAGEVRAVGGTWFADRLAGPTPYIHAIAMPGLSGKAQLMRLDLQGISVSQGSACSSGSLHSSHVLEAMGVPEPEAERTIRVSFGWSTTREEVERFCDAWLEMAREGAERAA
jgi:cysteine desulfurase